MSTKEKIKNEIDNLPEAFLKKVYEYIYSIKTVNSKRLPVRTFHLKGQYDKINIRQKAYEQSFD
ncbi:MAG: hypothetical protein HYY40_02200 [Bacteroidetes bacterium]|nr:hypothetical protein [Bacteroidota bacterium]